MKNKAMRNTKSVLTTLVLMAALGTALVATTGCTTVSAELQQGRFESPEVNGPDHRFGLQANLGSAHNYVLTNDANVRPPDFSNPHFDNGAVLGGAASFGLLEPLDISVKAAFGPSPAMLQMKYQLVGETHRAATEGDVSAAVTGAIGGGKNVISGSQDTLFGPGGHVWHGSVEAKTLDGSVIVGRRLNTHVLLYGGLFYTSYQINWSVDQNESDDHTQPAANFSGGLAAYQKGANVGFEFQIGPGLFTLEGVYSDAHAGNSSHSLLQIGGSAGLNF